jgi:peptidoglycan hydrolase CwlO-like protein
MINLSFFHLFVVDCHGKYVGPACSRSRSSTEIVSKVLSQTSAASTFLKNAGIETPVSKSASSAAREAQRREQLQAEKQRADLLQEVDTLKKKVEEIEESMARTQKVVLKTQQEMEEFKKKQEANDHLDPQLR